MQSETSVLFYAETNILQKHETPDGFSLRKATRCENIANLEELRKFCDKFIQYKNSVERGTYKIRLWFDTIIDFTYDEPNLSPRKIRMEGDKFSFLVSATNKLFYIEDALKMFKNPNILKWDEKYILHPMCVQSFDGKNIRLRPLTERDTVVRQSDFGQIWPIQTNQTPIQLINILNQNVKQGIIK